MQRQRQRQRRGKTTSVHMHMCELVETNSGQENEIKSYVRSTAVVVACGWLIVVAFGCLLA